MKKTMAFALVVTFVLISSLVLEAGSPAQASKRHWIYHRGSTILDKLVNTDGAEALVAAVLVVDGAELADCPQIGRLLADRRAKLTALAPNNTAFEEFLELPQGTLDGLSIDAIVKLLPDILDDLGLNANDVCNVLLNHVSVKGFQSKRRLLKRGQINVLGSDSDYPVSIGGAAGVWINYRNAITEANVFTVNGVIHYLDSVIAEDPFSPASE